MHTMLPTTQFLTRAIVLDSNLPFGKMEESYNLPHNVHLYDKFVFILYVNVTVPLGISNNSDHGNKTK